MRKALRRMLLLAGALLLGPRWAAAQEPITLSGRVTTDQGQPLGYAEVVVPSLGLGATTRDDGRYAIVIPGARATAGQSLAVTARRLGYKSVTLQLTLTPGIVERDFALTLNPLQLGELVVTGAGTVAPAEKLGNVRNNVDSALIQRSNEANVVQALAGKAPNVEITQSSGEPGAPSYIRIRGSRTLQGNSQPLFVVDGTPVDNSSFSNGFWDPVDGSGQFDGTTQQNRAVDINPNDIESVEILKGAAAGAIYGARAAQGVVLITTKSGRAGPTRFSFRSSASWDDVNNTYPLQTRYGQGLDGVAPAPGDCDDPGSSICRRSWGQALAAGTPVYDHANEAFTGGNVFENAFSVSGGNDRTTFYLSAENNSQDGVFIGPNDRFSRTTFRVKGSHRVIDNLRVSGNIAYADTRGRFLQRGNNVNGLQLALLRTPPEFDNFPYLDPVTGFHRSYRYQHPTALVADRGFDNPIYVIYEQYNASQVGRIFGNISADYLATSWLQFNYTLGSDYSADERIEGCPISSSDVCYSGRVIEGKIVNYQIDQNITATGNWRLNDRVSGNVTLGNNLNSRTFRQVGVVGRELIAPLPFKLSNTVSRDLPTDAETNIHNVSFFAQASVDMYQQLYVTLAARNDGSSTFGEQNRRNWFPKASAAWEFTKAAPALSWLQYGKLRLAYGQAGKEPDPYLTSTVFSSDGLLQGIAQGTGLLPSQGGFGGLATGGVRGATTLKPERTGEFEGGVDVSVWRERVDLHYTYYSATTSDMILNIQLPPSTGYFSEARNAAKMQNRGHELSVNFRPLTTPSYSWEFGFEWGRNRSKVLNLAGAQYYDLAGTFVENVAMVGQPLGAIRGYGFVRCGVSDPGAAGSDSAAFVAACAGAPKGAMYISAGGLPLDDPNARIVGDPNPDWTGGLTTTFRYKKFLISGHIDFRHGGDIWNGTKGALWSYGTHKDTENRATYDPNTDTYSGNEKVFGEGGWYDGPTVGPGKGTPVPIGQNWYKDGQAPCPFTGTNDEPCMENGGFTKLREISVQYTFDMPWVQRNLGLNSIDLRLAGRNLLTWSKYTGYDPETNLGGALSATTGVDYFNQPQSRSFAISVTLTR